MSIREAIHERISDIVAEVFPDARVYPHGSLPNNPPAHYVTYRRISNVHERHLLAGSGLTHARYEFNCYATRPTEADELYEAIRNNFNDVKNQQLGLANIRRAILDDDGDEFVPPTDASHQGKARVRMEFVISHTETVTPNI